MARPKKQVGNKTVEKESVKAVSNIDSFLKSAKNKTENNEDKNKAGEERKKAFQAAFSQINKKYGQGSIMLMSEKPKTDENALATGILSLDMAIGIGGLPRGRIIEIYGPEASGKTTVTLQMIAQAQKQGAVAAFIDVEQAMSLEYAKQIGVNVDELGFAQPNSGEEALDIVDTLVCSQAVDLVVIDSVAALVPQAELEAEMQKESMGLQARLMSKALRKITASINKSKTVVIFINQVRDKVGVMYGPTETTAGGRALKFYSSIRLDVRKKEVLKEGTNIIGNRVKVKVVKNKVAPPQKEAEFDIVFGTGISKESCILDVALQIELVERSGAFYRYKGDTIGQGLNAAKQYLIDNPQKCLQLENEVKEKLKTDSSVLSKSDSTESLDE